MTNPTSLREPKNPIVVPGYGPAPATGMIIGEAPGRQEIEQGRPFVGKSGTLLNEALTYGGGVPDRFFVTNVYQGDVGVGNRTPTTAEIEDHRSALEAEIASCNPSTILLLGRTATTAFLNDIERMADVVGTRYGRRILGMERHLFPCYHPSFVLRNPSYREEFRYTVLKFVLVTQVLEKQREDV